MTTLRSRRLGRCVVPLALAALLALATIISGCGASTTSPGGNTTPTPTPTPYHALVVAAPVLAPNSPATETTLRVLDSATGQLVWSHELNGYPGPFSPAVASGVVATSIGIPGQPYPAAEVAAFDVRTGAAQWHKDLPANTQGFVFAAGSSFIMVTAPVSAEASGSAYNLTVTALKPKDGSQIWQRALPKLDLSGPVISTDGTVFVSAAQVGSTPVSYLLTALDAASGNQLWQKPAGTGTLLNGVAADGRVYVSMYAGRPIVETRPAGPLTLPLAFALGPTISPLEGTLTAYRASDGAQLWRASGFTTVQAVVGSTLYATDIAPQFTGGTGMADFTVVAYDSATGAELWHSPRLAAADPFGSKPFVAADAHAAYVFDMPETTPGVHALTGGTGAQLWKALPNTVAYGAVAGLDKVFVGTTPSTPPGEHPVMQTTVTFYALDVASGATAWKMTLDDCLGARLALV